jgi:hypothetical protein
LNNLYRIYATGLLKKDEINIPTPDYTGSGKVEDIINLVFAIIGGVALIVLILAGIKFMTSQGNPDGVSKARTTILYAAIGLVISISALTIVNFVVGKL